MRRRGGGADVASFGVEEDGDVGGDGGDGRAQERHARLTQRFIEGDVGLVTADKLGGGLDDGPVPAQQRVANAICPASGSRVRNWSDGMVLRGAGSGRGVEADA